MSIEDELDQKMAHTQQQLEEIADRIRHLLDVEKIFSDASQELSGAASSLSVLSNKVNETVGIMQGALDSLRSVTEIIRSSDPGKITSAINSLTENVQRMRQDIKLARDENGKAIDAIGRGVASNLQAIDDHIQKVSQELNLVRDGNEKVMGTISALSEQSNTLHSDTQGKIADRANWLQQVIQEFASKKFNIIIAITVINCLIALAILIKLFK